MRRSAPRLAAWLGCAALVLAGCTTVETNMLVQQGQVRLDPHPSVSGAYRVTVLTLANPVRSLSPVNPTTAEGRRDLAIGLLGPACVAPVVDEESTTPLSPSVFNEARAQVVLRVTCAGRPA